MKTPLLIAGLLLAAGAGWFAARQWPGSAGRPHPDAPAGPDGRRILYYQSSMHPWIKSDKPGRCTICGMTLTPVFEGDAGFDAGPGMTVLGSNSIQVIHVQSVPAVRQPLERTLRVAGTIEEDDTRHRVLAAYVDGRMDRLFVNYVGAEVLEGEPLATIYSQALLNAERDYLSLLRQSGLDEFADLKSQRERMLAAAGLRLAQLGLTPDQIAALAGKASTNIHSEILAPMTGTVVRRLAYEGQYVKEGDPLFEIADFSVMWFRFDAYENDLPWIEPGQAVDVRTPAVAGKVFAGRVSFIEPSLRDETRSAKVRVEIPNPVVAQDGAKRRELYHRLYAEGRVQVRSPEVLAIPRTAVLNAGGKPVVYVDKGGGAYEGRAVALGRTGDSHYEILDGIEEGDEVVVSGNFLIDAQSQINTGASFSGGTGHDHGAHDASAPSGGGGVPPPASPANPARPGEPIPPLTDAQRSAFREVLNLAVALAAALAADDLPEYNRRASSIHDKVEALGTVLEADPGLPWGSFLKALREAGHAEAAGDLKSARKQFHPLSQAVVEASRALRRQDAAFQSLKIYRCPMTRTAFPGAPAIASWIQNDAPIRNPYFGTEMLDCGSEVKD